MRRATRAAFTLVELMVVIGLVIILVGSISIALRGRGSEGAALANAQTVLSSLVGTARAQAAVHHTNARVVIYSEQPPTGDSNKYLRSLIVVREDPATPGTFIAVGDALTLPAPVCVVLPAPVPATHLRTGTTWDNNVATGPVSTLAVAATFSYRGQPNSPANQFFGTTGSGRVFYLEFDATGAITSNTTTSPTKIALTTAILTNNAFPQFNNASAVRGLMVRKSGAISLVNDATSF
jgi:type II secretory pathway pseudopilin PulG